MELDDEIKVEEREVEVSPAIRELAEKNINVFGGDSLCPGCGPLLGLKIALQTIEDCILVGSPGCISLLTKYPNSVSVPFVIAENAPAVASAISKDKTDNTVLCYVGDGATEKNIQSLLMSARENENFIYICYNNEGCSILGKPREISLKKNFPKMLTIGNAKYSATASIAHVDDYIEKIKKAREKNGVRFIDLFCPCPILWGFDPSNTVEVARTAVETGVWPLYEIEKKEISLTARPRRLEPMERYLELQKRFRNLSEDDIKKIEEKVKRNWKYLLEKKLF